jgi:hypothetical protein
MIFIFVMWNEVRRVVKRPTNAQLNAKWRDYHARSKGKLIQEIQIEMID